MSFTTMHLNLVFRHVSVRSVEILLYIRFVCMLCCVCNGYLTPFLRREIASHRMLRKSLNTCYRFPKDKGVNIL